MKAAAWVVATAGALIGFMVVAYAFTVAEFVDGPQSSAVGDHARMVLVGLTIVVVALAIGAGLRRGDRWATYVFMALAALLALAAIWWTVGELVG
jgi:hypothetical protein